MYLAENKIVNTHKNVNNKAVTFTLPEITLNFFFQGSFAPNSPFWYVLFFLFFFINWHRIIWENQNDCLKWMDVEFTLWTVWMSVKGIEKRCWSSFIKWRYTQFYLSIIQPSQFLFWISNYDESFFIHHKPLVEWSKHTNIHTIHISQTRTIEPIY